jgi:hypothetical protein
MPEIGWIDALRRWNLGGTSWCVPKKGTAGYNTVMRIRHGEPAKVAEHVKEIERKKAKSSMTISLDSPKVKEELKVEIPMTKPARRKVKAKVPVTPKSKKSKKDDDMPVYEHPEAADYDARLAAFLKSIKK